MPRWSTWVASTLTKVTTLAADDALAIATNTPEAKAIERDDLVDDIAPDVLDQLPLTTDGDLLTQASGSRARLTRSDLADDAAFSGKYATLDQIAIFGSRFANITLTNEDSDTIETISGVDYRVVTWLSSGTFETDLPMQVEYLVVAGGGAGARAGGGGGGAGGLLSNVGGALLTVPVGAQVVTVGAGGPGLTTATPIVPGDNGTGSSFGSLVTTTGGGGGGRGNQNNAQSGGSGGGAGFRTTAGTSTGGANVSGQGNVGGSSTYAASAAAASGGGGAGAAGQSVTDSITAGNGGNGVANSITGTSVTYAGGGGGGGYTSGSTSGTGGTGGGGDGASSTTPATAGTDGLGGGGGAGAGVVNPNSADGGDGVVIVRWKV